MQSFGGITFLLHQNETGRCVVSTHLVRFAIRGIRIREEISDTNLDAISPTSKYCYSYRNDSVGLVRDALNNTETIVTSMMIINNSTGIA